MKATFAAAFLFLSSLVRAEVAPELSIPYHTVETHRTVAYWQDSLVMKDLWPGSGYYLEDSAFDRWGSESTWHLKGDYYGGDYGIRFFDTLAVCRWIGGRDFLRSSDHASLALYNAQQGAHISDTLFSVRALAHDSLVFSYAAAKDTAIFSLYWLDVNNDTDMYLPGRWSWKEIGSIARDLRDFYNQRHYTDLKRVDITRFEIHMVEGKAVAIRPQIPRLLRRPTGPDIDALGRRTRAPGTMRFPTPPLP